MESIGVHVTYHISISFCKNRSFLEIKFIKIMLLQYITSIIYSLIITFLCMVRIIGSSQKKNSYNSIHSKIINLYLLEGKQLIHSRILFDFHWLNIYIFFTYLYRCNNNNKASVNFKEFRTSSSNFSSYIMYQQCSYAGFLLTY